MTFESLRKAKKYIKENLPGSEYTICLNEDFAIINEDITRERRRLMILTNTISCKVAYLRTNGETK